jgi:hypothetical protein
MRQFVGQYSQHERFSLRNCLSSCLTIRHSSGQTRYFCYPAAIALLLNFYLHNLRLVVSMPGASWFCFLNLAIVSNQLPDPTPALVMPPAGQESWPRLGADH